MTDEQERVDPDVEESDDDDDDDDDEVEKKTEEITDLSNSDVCTKYQEASKIVNLTLEGLVKQCIPGAKVVDLCIFGSSVMEAAAGKLYTKKVNGVLMDRGVAFPVCISVNDIVCNHSPLLSEEIEPLKVGDVVKIDLGCHLDGYIAVAAHTVVVADGDAPPTPAEEVGNVAVAAYNAMLVAAHSIAAGKTNTDVTKAVERVAMHYGVKPISSVRMHQMKRYVLDGVKEISLKEPTPEDLEEGEEKLASCTFEQNEVYAVDVAMSTGDGKAKPGEMRTTVFKRNVETNYKLKMKSSRTVLSEVDKKFPTLPFTLRHFEDEKQAKMGIAECILHNLVTPYPSLHEHSGKVAHFKCTVLLLPSGTTRVTGLDLPAYFTTTKEPDEATAAVLKELADAADKKAKKKAAKKKKGKKTEN
ncbi:Proliferation-associated protein [Fragilaria crotonensis]|nr:Proliferation-associated protein [Fragilaria crotonensis]